MITAIVTMMVTAIISTVARYVAWQISVVGNPLYKYLLWHILLFAILIAVNQDRKQGFKRIIGIFGSISAIYCRTTKKEKINSTMSAYRGHSRKFSYKAILIPVVITLSIAYILSAQLVFFAIITSSSMEPTFEKGDLVFMQNILVKPQVGDIIIFPDRSNTKVSNRPLTITHRIVSIDGNNIRTKGDNNPSMDSWTISRKELLGEAIIFNKKPVVLKDVGKYFLLDFSSTSYTREFVAIATTIQNIRAFGILIFFTCLVFYIFLSIRDSRSIKPEISKSRDTNIIYYYYFIRDYAKRKTNIIKQKEKLY